MTNEVDQLAPIAFAQHLRARFAQSAPMAVLTARAHWRRLDSEVLRYFQVCAEDAAVAIGEPGYTDELISGGIGLEPRSEDFDPRGTDEFMIFTVLSEIAQQHGDPPCGLRLRAAAVGILQQQMDLARALELAIEEGPPSMLRIRQLMAMAAAMGALVPANAWLVVTLAAAMAVPSDALATVVAS